MRNRLLLTALSILALASCGPKVFRSEAVPVQVDRVVLFEPTAYVSYISSGNNAVPNDSMSRITGLLAESVLRTTQGVPAIDRKITFDNPLTDSVFRHEIDLLYGELAGTNRHENVAIPPMIDSLMDASGERFGMLVSVAGFTRSTGNYIGQLAKGAGLQLLTGVVAASLGGGFSMGVYPHKARMAVGIALVDNQKKEIAFFGQIESDSASEPLSEKAVEKYIGKIFKRYNK